MIVAGTGNLGALPVILTALVKGVAQYKWNQAQINSALAEQFETIQGLREAEITEFALLLAGATGRPYWEWFTVLRNAQELGYFDTGAGNGTPPPPPPPKDNTILWMAVVGAVVLVVALR